MGINPFFKLLQRRDSFSFFSSLSNLSVYRTISSFIQPHPQKPLALTLLRRQQLTLIHISEEGHTTMPVCFCHRRGEDHGGGTRKGFGMGIFPEAMSGL
jgi:hypothetical protein